MIGRTGDGEGKTSHLLVTVILVNHRQSSEQEGRAEARVTSEELVAWMELPLSMRTFAQALSVMLRSVTLEQ